MSNSQLPDPPQQASQYSVDWNNVALEAITAGLDEIPVVGGILANLLSAFWPESGQDVWAEIKQNVETLINQAVSQDDYNRVQAQLGSISQGSGLVGVLSNYLASVNPNPDLNNKQDPQVTWGSANTTFIAAQSAFQQQGIELLLLPLFAQFANMHLSLLRDGVVRNWVGASELQQRISSYSQYAETWYQNGLQARSSANDKFNYLNQYVQQMQLGVMNFRETWAYFDPTKYSPPVKVSFSGQTYFTITGSLSLAGGSYGAMPAVPDLPITNIDVYWLNDLLDSYNLVQGTQVSYGDTQETYTGILINNAPPVQKPCNPDNDYFCNFKQGVVVSPDNPIVGVNGVFTVAGGTFSVEFLYQDGTSTGQIPNQNQQSYPVPYSITPPKGYFLSSVWAPSFDAFYGSASDVIFGFRYAPASIGQATAQALYVSSLHPVSLTSPKFAPFAAVAASEDWDGQRQQFFSRIQQTAKS